MTPPQPEIRSIKTFTVEGEWISGTAIPKGEVTTIYPEYGRPYKETVPRNAKIRYGKVQLFTEHRNEKTLPYADTDSGTLILTEDDNGIHYRGKLPPFAEHEKYAVEHKIIKGASWRMYVNKEHRTPDGVRSLDDISIDEISLTANPSYKRTSAQLRSAGPYRAIAQLIEKIVATDK